MIDWDDEFANAAYIAGGDEFPARWAAAARDYRALCLNAGRALCDLPYGNDPRHRFDLFLPVGTPCGLMVFVHGGYWLAFDKDSWSHLAQGAVDRGYAVAVPSYPLCPQERIGAITSHVALAIAAAAAQVAGPIMLAGHSAGGQIVARLATQTSPLARNVQARLVRVVAISGLHDLRPLLHTTMNATLRLDTEEAVRESPALCAPRAGVSVTAWVGADERPEFIRQSRLLATAWPAAVCVVAPGRHHFDVVDALADHASPLVNALLE